MKEDDIQVSLEKGRIEDVAEEVLRDPELLPKLLAGISSKNPRVKFGAAKTLRLMSEKNPKMLYSKVGFFANLIDSKNNILKWIAMDIIANLTAVDSHDEFNRLFKKFYGYLYEGSLITAGHVVDNSGKIALSKPDLQDKITDELLKVEKVPLPTSECRNILIGKAINAFNVYYNEVDDKDKVISFVKRQLNNPRKATKNKAEKFLRKFSAH